MAINLMDIEFEQTLGVGAGQEALCHLLHSMDCKELIMDGVTELNWIGKKNDECEYTINNAFIHYEVDHFHYFVNIQKVHDIMSNYLSCISTGKTIYDSTRIGENYFSKASFLPLLIWKDK